MSVKLFGIMDAMLAEPIITPGVMLPWQTTNMLPVVS